jgi:hypothetical protein
VTDLTERLNSCIGQSSPVRPVASQAGAHVLPMLILMLKNKAMLLLALMLAGGIGGPVAYFQLFAAGKSPSQAAAGEPQTALPQTAGLASLPLPGGVANIAAPQTLGAAAPQSSVRLHDASSVFDFQVTPEWVVAHWPSVSTGLAQLQLEGYRVPLVTGTGQQDLAGSLTYYFSPEQKLQQITFIGTTGDPRPLIGLLSGRFHLTRRLANDPGLIVFEAVRGNNELAGSLKLRLAPQTEPNEPYRRYDIELSLARPSE